MNDTKIWVVLAPKGYFLAACASKEAARQKVINFIKSEIYGLTLQKESYEEGDITTEEEAKEYEEIIRKIDDLESSVNFFRKCSCDYTEVSGGFIVRPDVLHTLKV